MIREILFPTRVGSYVLFSQKILSIDLSENTLKVMLLTASGSKITINKWQAFEIQLTEDYENAFQIIKKDFGTSFDQIIVTISAQKISFKVLSLPFGNLAKIRQILPFELAETLPFSLEESVLDAIPSNPTTSTDQTSWVACAMQTEALNRTLLPILEEGFLPTRVTTGPIDFFTTVLYSKHIEAEKTYVLIDVNSVETQISLIHNRELLGIRILPKGLPIKNQSDGQGENIVDGQENQIKIIHELIKKIVFSIEALLRPNKQISAEYTILLNNETQDQEIFETLLKEQTNSKIISIKPIDLIKLPNIQQESNVTPDSAFLKTLMAALPWAHSSTFNLGQFFQKDRNDSIFMGQTILTGFLLLLLLGTPITRNILQSRHLKQEIETSKKEVSNRLKKEFNLQGRQRNIKDTLTQSEQALIKNEQLWSALTTNKYAFLRYIQKLNTALSNERSKLNLQKLSIRRDELSGQEILGLEGSVDNFSTLRDFEEGLNASGLFAAIPRLQDLRFSILLPIKKDARDELS